MQKYFILFLSLVILFGCSTTPTDDQILTENSIDDLKSAFEDSKMPFYIPPATKVDSIEVNDSTMSINIITNKRFSYRPFRENDINEISNDVRTFLGPKYYNYDINIFSMGYPLEELIPNYFRPSVNKYDFSRIPDSKVERPKP